MKVFVIFCCITAFFALLFFTVTYIFFRMAFYASRKKKHSGNKSHKDSQKADANISSDEMPEGKIYDPFRESIRKWARETRGLPRTEYTITSFDGLPLHGRFFEYAKGAPIELMFHGYRGTAERDLSGGVQRCFQLERSAFLVDQRCSGKSGGNVITFGIREYRDCLSWVDFMIKEFGPDVKIILTGISMGAATVTMAAGQPLPPNVIGALADCGYTSPKEIIIEVIRQMKLPPAICYPFVKLAARMFGHFDLEEYSPVEAMEHCTVPIIFFHGESDDFVPCHMSKTNYDVCGAPKRLVTIPGAGHGLAFPMDPPNYLAAAREFFEPYM